jgi:ADP-L-glycero-D-manno-heptose 6-epimerase
MFIVTGGAGFIGSNLLSELNRQGCFDILVVDNLADSSKFLNLKKTVISDYLDKDDFIERIQLDYVWGKIQGLFHLGACADTMEYDGRKMMKDNYEYSKILSQWAVKNKIPMVYASSAAVYGAGTHTEEIPQNESPLNIYGYSKLLFDQYVRQHFLDIQTPLTGLRFFNVFGPRESHKGKMASMGYQLYRQIKARKTGFLFEGTNGYGNGEQKRDFIFVEDIVSLLIYFMGKNTGQRIYNAGTGSAHSFNELGKAVIYALGYGKIEYIPFPEPLKSKYQNFTKASITRLHQAGYRKPFISLEEGILKSVATWECESV